MGAYINPVNQSKESWLKEHGEAIDEAPKSFDERMKLELPVCLVDNGPFTAAGIAFDERELQAFTYPDHRPKQWYWVSTKKLMDLDVSSLPHYLKD
jgi:hypothetical protein